MRILFTGLPYFSQQLVDDLNEWDSENKYVFLNTYYSKIDQIKFLIYLFRTDLVVSFNGAYSRSRALDVAIFFKKKIMMQWHGTDVLKAIESSKSNNLDRKYIQYATHFTDAVWLQQELESINIESKILPFKYLKEQPKLNQCFKTLDAVSYVAKGKESFYGIKNIITLSQQFPQTTFHIVGTNELGYKTAKNIKFYGWISQEAFKKLRATHPIFIRLTQHDGYSLSVMEALSSGNEVLWNYPHSQCAYFDAEQDIALLFKQIQERVVNRKFMLNTDNIIWAQEHLNRSKILSNFVMKINALGKS